MHCSGVAIQTLEHPCLTLSPVEGVAQNDQKDTWAADAQCIHGTEMVPEEREGQQGRLQEAEGGLICSNPKGMSSTTTLCSGLVDGMKTAPLEKAATPEGEQESLCGNNHKEQFLNLDEYLTNGK